MSKWRERLWAALGWVERDPEPPPFVPGPRNIRFLDGDAVVTDAANVTFETKWSRDKLVVTCDHPPCRSTGCHVIREPRFEILDREMQVVLNCEMKLAHSCLTGINSIDLPEFVVEFKMPHRSAISGVMLAIEKRLWKIACDTDLSVRQMQQDPSCFD